jgi:HAD superfamily hydrolase (TIGR01509 family)
MQFSAYIFDVEGTLVDCVSQKNLSRQEALAHFGVTVAYDVLQLYSGLDANQALQLVAPDLDADGRKKAIEEESKLYRSNYLGTVKAVPEVRKVFELLRDAGGRIALATDCKGPVLQHYFSLLNAIDLVEVIACGDDAEHGKPDPALVAVAIQKLGVTAANAVMVGDTPYDAEAAQAAGAAAAGVLTGGFLKPALTGAGCVFIAEDIRELPKLLNVRERPSLAAG